MKRLFNFYLDDDVREQATKKINNLLGGTNKGALAALIRSMLNDFVECEDDEQLNTLAIKVMSNYIECQHSNKRSRL